MKTLLFIGGLFVATSSLASFGGGPTFPPSDWPAKSGNGSLDHELLKNPELKELGEDMVLVSSKETGCEIIVKRESNNRFSAQSGFSCDS